MDHLSINKEVLDLLEKNKKKHLEFTKYCELIISMSYDVMTKEIRYNTFINNLELITKQMKEKFYKEESLGPVLIDDSLT